MANNTSNWKAWLELVIYGIFVAIIFLVMLVLIVPFPITIWTGSASDWLNVLLYAACVTIIGTLLLRGPVGKSRKKSQATWRGSL